MQINVCFFCWKLAPLIFYTLGILILRNYLIKTDNKKQIETNNNSQVKNLSFFLFLHKILTYYI